MPNGNGDLCRPGEAEHALETERHFANAELGARCEIVAELPGNVPGRCIEDSVPLNAVLVANCELECTESWERVSDGDDILFS